ncbi:hypothetical protein SAMN02745136_05536 [Anaerocolumna jejuensis DSM 15929]|uniref:Uncharacterized protein n=1 Tax=Anaerocolumna jejuensis DSM 15929 TaxID=1121322 RepID=A0A1M7CWP2_9FIRM|nr:hypothetical protein SAMN02745136_05536 [Anaerocolumna jejuensis DSM 15929]
MNNPYFKTENSKRLGLHLHSIKKLLRTKEVISAIKYGLIHIKLKYMKDIIRNVLFLLHISKDALRPYYKKLVLQHAHFYLYA